MARPSPRKDALDTAGPPERREQVCKQKNQSAEWALTWIRAVVFVLLLLGLLPVLAIAKLLHPSTISIYLYVGAAAMATSGLLMLFKPRVATVGLGTVALLVPIVVIWAALEVLGAAASAR